MIHGGAGTTIERTGHSAETTPSFLAAAASEVTPSQRGCCDDGGYRRRTRYRRFTRCHCLVVGGALQMRAMIPTRLADWTIDVVRTIVESGVTENDVFDLKADLQDAPGQRKVVAAFANTRGGFLVYGVTDDRRIVGVSRDELPSEFGGKLRDELAPSVSYEFAKPIDVVGGRRLFIVEIPRSKRGPHAVRLNGGWTFLKRTAAGNNDPMSVEEIRGAFTESDRRHRDLAWIQADLARINEVGRRLNAEAHGSAIDLEHLLTRFDASQIKALVPGVFDTVNTKPALVSNLQMIIDLCEKADAIRGPMVAHALAQRDRSYSRSNDGGVALLKDCYSRIPIFSQDALNLLASLDA